MKDPTTMRIKVPAGQKIEERHFSSSGVIEWVITSNSARTIWSVFSVDSCGTVKRIGKGKNPIEARRDAGK